MNGYIQLPRTLYESSVWKLATAEQIRAYLDLCFNVTYTAYECNTKFGKVKLEKGQFVTSLRTLASNWQCDVSKVRRILKFLKDHNLVSVCKIEKQDATQETTQETTHTTTHCTLLTINDLHSGKIGEVTQEVTQETTHINKKGLKNNLSDDKSVCEKRAHEEHFVPPTIDEIQQYLDERQITSFRAEEFFNYYESVGWLVGKDKKMKSWHGAVGTWHSKRINNNNSNNYGTKNINYTNDRQAAATQRHEEFVRHIFAKLNGQEKRSDELPFA